MASIAPGFANLFTQLPGLSRVAKFAAGMPQQRRIPAFAPETFKSWFKRHKSRAAELSFGSRPGAAAARRVILWPDTFNNYFFPETAIAAVDVLERAGYVTRNASELSSRKQRWHEWRLIKRRPRSVATDSGTIAGVRGRFHRT